MPHGGVHRPPHLGQYPPRRTGYRSDLSLTCTVAVASPLHTTTLPACTHYAAILALFPHAAQPTTSASLTYATLACYLASPSACSPHLYLYSAARGEHYATTASATVIPFCYHTILLHEQRWLRATFPHALPLLSVHWSDKPTPLRLAHRWTCTRLAVRLVPFAPGTKQRTCSCHLSPTHSCHSYSLSIYLDVPSPHWRNASLNAVTCV